MVGQMTDHPTVRTPAGQWELLRIVGDIRQSLLQESSTFDHHTFIQYHRMQECIGRINLIQSRQMALVKHWRLGLCLDSNEAVPWAEDLGGSNFAGASNCFIAINFVLFIMAYALSVANFNNALLLACVFCCTLCIGFFKSKPCCTE